MDSVEVFTLTLNERREVVGTNSFTADPSSVTLPEGTLLVDRALFYQIEKRIEAREVIRYIDGDLIASPPDLTSDYDAWCESKLNGEFSIGVQNVPLLINVREIQAAAAALSVDMPYKFLDENRKAVEVKARYLKTVIRDFIILHNSLRQYLSDQRFRIKSMNVDSYKKHIQEMERTLEKASCSEE